MLECGFGSRGSGGDGLESGIGPKVERSNVRESMGVKLDREASEVLDQLEEVAIRKAMVHSRERNSRSLKSHHVPLEKGRDASYFEEKNVTLDMRINSPPNRFHGLES